MAEEKIGAVLGTAELMTEESHYAADKIQQKAANLQARSVKQTFCFHFQLVTFHYVIKIKLIARIKIMSVVVVAVTTIARRLLISWKD